MNQKHRHFEKATDMTISDQLWLARKIGGRSSLGFYRYYFSELRYFKTQKECFQHVNDLYHFLFGEYRYESYTSFSNGFKIKLKEI